MTRTYAPVSPAAGHRNRLTGLLMAACVLAGCASAAQQGCDCAPVYVECDDGSRIWARFVGETAFINLDHRTLRLTLEPSASGALYSDGRVTLWTKGQQARLDVMGTHDTRSCTIGE